MSVYLSESSVMSTIDYNGPHTIVSTTTPSTNFSINLHQIPIRTLPVHGSGEIIIKHDPSPDKDRNKD